MQLGYIYALLASMFIAVQYVPRKFSKATTAVYTLYAGAGWLVFALVYYFVSGLFNGEFESLANPLLLFSRFVGIFRMLGIATIAAAIQKAGLARTNQWKGLAIPIGTISCLIFLSEFTKVHVEYVIAGMVTMFISATLFSIPQREEGGSLKWSVLLAILGAFFFGINLPMQKYVTMNGIGVPTQNLCSAFFMFMAASVYAAISRRTIKIFQGTLNKNSLWGFSAGVANFFVFLFSLMAYQFISASIANTLYQLDAVWIILIGIWYFKEVDFKKHWVRICVGMAFAIVSIGLALFA